MPETSLERPTSETTVALAPQGDGSLAVTARPGTEIRRAYAQLMSLATTHPLGAPLSDQARLVERRSGLGVGPLGDGHADRLSDVAKPSKAGGTGRGFVALDLLIGHAEALGQVALPSELDTPQATRPFKSSVPTSRTASSPVAGLRPAPEDDTVQAVGGLGPFCWARFPESRGAAPCSGVFRRTPVAHRASRDHRAVPVHTHTATATGEPSSSTGFVAAAGRRFSPVRRGGCSFSESPARDARAPPSAADSPI